MKKKLKSIISIDQKILMWIMLIFIKQLMMKILRIMGLEKGKLITTGLLE